MHIALLASGRGSNLETILKHAASGKLQAKPCLVLSNNPEAGALEHARKYDVPVWSMDHRSLPREEFDRNMLEAIQKAGAEAIVLAGYMRLLSGSFIQAFTGRILNIHPALLPSFPGVHGGQDALDYRVRIAGCSVHFVEEKMDAGPVVIQAAVPVGQDDQLSDLMGRIHALEHRIYPQAIQWLAQGRLQIEGRMVRLLPADSLYQTAVCAGSENSPSLVSPELEEF